MTLYPHTHKRGVTWEEIHELTNLLCRQLPLRTGGIGGLITVDPGGLVPLTIMSHILKLPTHAIFKPHELAHLHRYPHLLAQTSPSPNLIVIDDVCDKGMTFYLLKQHFPNAYYCCLYGKPQGRDQWDLCTCVVPQDCWLVMPWETDDES